MFNSPRRYLRGSGRFENPRLVSPAPPQTSQRMQSEQPQRSNPGRPSGGWSRGSHLSERASLPLSLRLLRAMIDERDADGLVVALSTKPGWTLLLESEFGLGEVRAIFSALKKCCKASSVDLLRRFLHNTLSSDKFVNRCCLLLSAIDSENLKLAEDVISVLQTSASLQPAGLARPCMVILCSLDGNRNMASWNEASELDLSAKVKTTREQLSIAANNKSAARIATSGSKIYRGYRTSGPAPSNFREMSILPTQKDLEEEHPFLRPNIVKGAYESLEDYLDVQFRLLREDYVTPLRDGLREFKEVGSEMCRWKLRAIKDVRFYTGVSYQKPEANTAVLAVKERITLSLAPEDFKHINWSRSKRFTNGALIGISKDKFETIIFATVSHRNPEALQQNGTLTLELCFDEDRLEFRPEMELSLIESSGAYFEAYRHNLAVIQTMTEMPLSDHLVFAVKDVEPPSFAFPGSLNLDPILKNSGSSKTNFWSMRWPQQDETILNVRQLEAVKSAFSRELCVIQGPPGTGKTFVGLKIVELMLRNRVTTKPFLIVCYTNHALDQFVEGISKFTTEIVRLGGRCDSEELQRFTLRVLRREERHQHGRYTDSELINLQRLLWRLRSERSGLMSTVESIEQELALLQGRAVFGECEALGSQLGEKLKLDSIEQIVMPGESTVCEDELEDDGNLSDEDRGEVETDDFALPINCNSRKEEAIRKLLGSHTPDQSTDRFDTMSYTRYKFERRREYIRIMEERGIPPSELPLNLDLDLGEWWQLYREIHWEQAVKRAKNYIATCRLSSAPYQMIVSSEELLALHKPNMDDIEWTIRCLSSRLMQIRNEILRNLKESSEAETLADFEIIKKCKIIGVTTTGAAKFNMMLRRVEYEIVVVEEAAEVLEAHLITTLCPSTKQLILIGDHQQLQPSAVVYKLATSFNLQISLFERLINNGIPFVRLQEQHRMRDQFLKLLVPTIYADYFSHQSVFGYENIRGLSQNLFFVTHENSEESEGENSSKSNLFEADFAACLALYLRMQGYAPSQIVILTTYSGQVFAIRSVIREIEQTRCWTGMKTIVDRQHKKTRVPVKQGLPISMFEGIRITTVDNYQGEESDIVIASFVRSNEDQKIGFLSKDNRVCVALSRAKKGFYCIGNIAMLAQASRTWENISRTLLDGSSVNKGLELFCDIHDKRLLASTPSDFDKFSDGGCSQPCGLRLNCGHTCPKTCHKLDADHAEFLCRRECQRERPCGHPCARECHLECGPCHTRVRKLRPCGHDANLECHVPPESTKCRVVVKKSLLRCTHTAEFPCCDPIDKFLCGEPCERFMPCGAHRCNKKCHERCGRCMEFVDAKSPCGHVVRVVCRDSENENSLRSACDTGVEVQLPCGHTNMVPCREQGSALSESDTCKKPTEVICSSGHSFTVKCPIARSGTEDAHCGTKIPVALPCGHEVMRLCKQTRNLDIDHLSAECKKLVESILSCGHKLNVQCKQKTGSSSEDLQKMCQTLIEETLVCGHQRTRKCNTNEPCVEKVTVKSLCGHEVVTPCSMKEDVKFIQDRCTAKCDEILQCQHLCAGTCCAGSGDGFHRKCSRKCDKTLFCGHRCFSGCHSQCNPCLVKEKLWCPHGSKVTECLSSIHEPCNKRPQHCAHVKCDAVNCADCHCSCDSNCHRILPCGAPRKDRGRNRKPVGGPHKCVGLCSELCVCSSCDVGAMNTAVLPRGVKLKAARFIKLPCGHVFEVSWLDDYMQKHNNQLSFPKCPVQDCSAQVRLTKRYHRLLERIRLNMREVYTRVFGDLNEMREAHQKLFKECQSHRSTVEQSSEDLHRKNQTKIKTTRLLDKIHDSRRTPSRFVLDYLHAVFTLMKEETADVGPLTRRLSEIIHSEELQLQLLSDYVVAVNRERVAQGLRPKSSLSEPVRADKWAICEKNHVLSTEVDKRCLNCPVSDDSHAGISSKIDASDRPRSSMEGAHAARDVE